MTTSSVESSSHWPSHGCCFRYCMDDSAILDPCWSA